MNYLVACYFYSYFKLLDEMLDNGFPLTTESNILKELIKPPKLLRSLAEVVTGRSVGGVVDTLPVSQLTNTRWRRTGVKYATNEAFFDVTERVNAIIDRSGNVLLAEVEGAVCLIIGWGFFQFIWSHYNVSVLSFRCTYWLNAD